MTRLVEHGLSDQPSQKSPAHALHEAAAAGPDNPGDGRAHAQPEQAGANADGVQGCRRIFRAPAELPGSFHGGAQKGFVLRGSQGQALACASRPGHGHMVHEGRVESSACHARPIEVDKFNLHRRLRCRPASVDNTASAERSLLLA